MGNIHVGRDLDRDQRIFRYVGFYDLIELLTFSQISFACAESRPPAAATANEETAPSPAIRLAHQSWTLLHREDAIAWHAPDMSQPRICIVSSIGALAESLFTNDTTNVFIERTCRVVQGPAQAPFRQSPAPPVLQDGTVSVIVSAEGDAACAGPRPGSLRLLADLKALLLGVIVSPDASIRFVELTSKLVQHATNAFVSRASLTEGDDYPGSPHGPTVQYPAYPYPMEAAEKAARFSPA